MGLDFLYLQKLSGPLEVHNAGQVTSAFSPSSLFSFVPGYDILSILTNAAAAHGATTVGHNFHALYDWLIYITQLSGSYGVQFRYLLCCWRLLNAEQKGGRRSSAPEPIDLLSSISSSWNSREGVVTVHGIGELVSL